MSDRDIEQDAESVKVPAEPVAFWGGHRRAAMRYRKLMAQYSYVTTHKSDPDHIEKIMNRLGEAQRVYEAFKLRAQQLLDEANATGDMTPMAPYFAFIRKHRFKPIVDGYVVLGKRRGVTVVQRVAS